MNTVVCDKEEANGVIPLGNLRHVYCHAWPMFPFKALVGFIYPYLFFTVSDSYQINLCPFAYSNNTQ